MHDLIWQIAAGGFLQAAQEMGKRCGASPQVTALTLSTTADTCLAAAFTVVSHGKTVGNGLQAIAPVFDHLGGNPLVHALDNPWNSSQEEWTAGCPNGKFGSKLELEIVQKTAKKLYEKMEQALAKEDYAQLDDVCEKVLTFLPLFPGDEQDGDISLYDSARLTAALASCYAHFIQENPETDCATLRERDSLLLFSCDFSGIQNFIYLISTKSALKMLRSRSFFLELLMAHLLDELLDTCDLARCNCLYSGGGHAYVLLPNTQSVKQAVQAFSDSVNHWLQAQFGISLYLACGCQPCSPAALFGQAGQQAYSDVFRGLSAKLGHAKLTRCDAEMLRDLNHSRQDARECRICGRPAQQNDLCNWCDRFSRLGGRLTVPHQVFAITSKVLEQSQLWLPMPGINGDRFACVLSVEQAKGLPISQEILRWYSKNEIVEELVDCRCLRMGDHCPTSLLEELSQQSEGVARMGVFRADVDNLGKAFISGFARQNDTQNLVSLARTMAFSRSMSMFFQNYINQILNPFSGVLVVYSGGDDLFLVGGWSELLRAAVQLHQAFVRYTGGALTFSGGFGLYTDHYPIARAAQETAELEDFSKQNPGKNALTLFAESADLRFEWPVFESCVMAEKYQLLDSFFGEDENGRGQAFLYQLLEYLRQAQDRLNLARCAYLLARLRPGRDSTEKQKKAYEVFSQNFYRWALQPEDRRQLIAAIYLYVYLNRKKDEED